MSPKQCLSYNNRRSNSNPKLFTITNEMHQTEEIILPTNKVGIIIGSGGSTIRSLQEQTNCFIKVLKNHQFCEETKIILKGCRQEIIQAKEKINSLTKITFRKQIHSSFSLNPSEPSNATYGSTYSSSQDNTNEIAKEAPQEKSITIDWEAVISDGLNALSQRWKNAPSFRKVFYQEPEHIKNLSPEVVSKIRNDLNSISVVDLSDENSEFRNMRIFNPISKFEDAFNNFPKIMETIKQTGFDKPSPIQCQAWPIILGGRDCIGIAQTGTGKTLAFLLPILVHVSDQDLSSMNGPRALILAPTRELAIQIEKEVKKFSYKGLRSICVYGGSSRRNQVRLTESGVEIVIATPGRLIDLAQSGVMNLDAVTFLVLDEADRMLDMGFEPDIRKIAHRIRPDRQTVMTSATWPYSVRRLAESFMISPIQINVGSLNLTSCKNVKQCILFVEPDEKGEELRKFLLSMGETEKCIVFVGRKMTANDLSCEYMMDNFLDGAVQTIHGDREQCDREIALAELKSGIARVLIATDVASRGLDVDDVSYVVNYDFPKTMEEYVHRIGRTGRAGKYGTSLTFFSRENRHMAEELIGVLNDANQLVPDELVMMAEQNATRKLEREQNLSDSSSRFRRPNKNCFKCGLSGHIARMCSSATFQ